MGLERELIVFGIRRFVGDCYDICRFDGWIYDRLLVETFLYCCCEESSARSIALVAEWVID